MITHSKSTLKLQLQFWPCALYPLKLTLLSHLMVFLYITWRYDFDKDGYIIKEDVRLVMSHIPIENTVGGAVIGEGKFTQTGGGK